MGLSGQQQSGFLIETIMSAAAYVVIGLLQIDVGRVLRKFTLIGKIGGAILGMIGLLGTPLGTLFSGYMLCLLLSAKGKSIFLPEYQEVLKATPDIVYQTSKTIVVLAILLLLLFIAVGILALGTTGS